MKFVVIVLVSLVLLSALCEAGRKRNKRRYREGQVGRPDKRHGHRGGRQPFTSSWRKHLDRLLGRINSKDYGFGLDWGDDDFKINVNFGWDTKQWWQGKNVCKSKSVDDSNDTESDGGMIARHFSYHSHICDETESAYKCITTSQVLGKKKVVTEVYECCPGYTRKENEIGCPRKHKLENLVDTARGLGLHEFLRAADSVSMTEELKAGNFTVFAPVDKAFSSLKDALPDIKTVIPQRGDLTNSVVMVSKPVKELILKDMQNLLLGHLAVGQYKTSSLQDEQLIETGSPYKAKIRINFYDTPQKLMTANCVPVLSTDHQATNGVIHTVKSLLQPVTSSIVDIISRSPELGYLKTALARADLVQVFRQDGQFTMFAPTDTAFNKMDPGLRDNLLNGDSKCLRKVLENHVLPNVICSSIIKGRVKSKNVLGRFTNLTRDENDKLFIDNAQVVAQDIMTTNGVIHLLDEVLLPDEALRVTDQIDNQGGTKFLGLMKQAKIITDLMKASNLTVFMPTNEAFQDLPESVSKRFDSDPEFLKEVLQYHVVPEELDSNLFYNNYHLDTLNGERQIRINEYSSFPYMSHWTQTAQCSPISKRNVPSCNGVINIVDKVLLPPKGNVVDILAMDKRFSELVRLIKISGIADGLQAQGPFTIFAPTNKAFDALGSKTVKMLTENMDELRIVLKNHLAQDALCCAGIFKAGWYGSPRVRTLGGQTFHLHRNADDKIKIGSANVETCDLSGTNGVVHVIDHVLVEGERRGMLGRLLRGWRQRQQQRHRQFNPWDWL